MKVEFLGKNRKRNWRNDKKGRCCVVVDGMGAQESEGEGSADDSNKEAKQ